MNAQEYRQRVRKAIVCPSGLEVEIRKLSSLDFLQFGLMPDVFAPEKREESQKDPVLLAKLNAMLLTRGVVGKVDLRLVDKSSYEISDPTELSIYDLAEPDLIFIINEINSLTFPNKEVIDPKPFLEEWDARGIGPDGSEVRSPAEPDDEPGGGGA